tara:strand:- start:1261 stop:1467 length:207 start_codon:yes stop_codon:yes gene_type:complete
MSDALPVCNGMTDSARQVLACLIKEYVQAVKEEEEAQREYPHMHPANIQARDRWHSAFLDLLRAGVPL